MSTNQPDIERFQRAVETSLREHWVVFLIEGIVLLILGAAAIVIPPLATLSVTIFLGWLFLVSGIVGLIATFQARQAPGFWWSLLSAAVAILAGVVLIFWPLSGAVSLTLVAIVFFAIEGFATVMYALEHKRELSGRWGWMLVSGIVDLFLAAVIFAGLPRHRFVGDRAARRHQHDVRRHRAHHDGAARPRGRAGRGRVGALRSGRA